MKSQLYILFFIFWRKESSENEDFEFENEQKQIEEQHKGQGLNNSKLM